MSHLRMVRLAHVVFADFSVKRSRASRGRHGERANTATLAGFGPRPRAREAEVHVAGLQVRRIACLSAGGRLACEKGRHCYLAAYG